MKLKLLLIVVALNCILPLDFSAAHAQTLTSFTYQGRLTTSNVAATGSYDFQFRLLDAEVGGDELKQQQSQLDELKATVCSLIPDATICKEKKK